MNDANSNAVADQRLANGEPKARTAVLLYRVTAGKLEIQDMIHDVQADSIR